MRETERRCDALIDSSREPIAYIHEGIHIRANPAYLEMFGYESFEDIEGMSLLDLVAPEHVDAFKQLLKRLSKGEPPPPRHELTARDIEGRDFPAVMEFTAAQYEGEPCQQVIFRRQAQDVDPELPPLLLPWPGRGPRPAADRAGPLRPAAGGDRPGRRRPADGGDGPAPRQRRRGRCDRALR